MFVLFVVSDDDGLLMEEYNMGDCLEFGI